jgi:hypothetical protein
LDDLGNAKVGTGKDGIIYCSTLSDTAKENFLMVQNKFYPLEIIDTENQVLPLMNRYNPLLSAKESIQQRFCLTEHWYLEHELNKMKHKKGMSQLHEYMESKAPIIRMCEGVMYC